MRQATMLDGKAVVRHVRRVEDRKQSGATSPARLTLITLYVWMAAELAVFVTGLDYVAGGGYDVWFATGPIVALTLLISVVVQVVTGIVVLVWIHRAMAVAHRLTPGLTISPGWAVGWFFVPVASLWKPYEAMVQIVEGSSPDAAAGKRGAVRDLIIWWWGAWIARSFLALFVGFASGVADGLSPGQVTPRIVWRSSASRRRWRCR